MNKSKSIKILKSFSPDEIKKFSNFLESPYFNTNKRVIKLFSEIKKHYPEFTSKSIEKENIYKKIFPGKPYNEQVMKNLVSELLRLEKEFLSVEGFINDPGERSLKLINHAVVKNLDFVFNKGLEEIQEIKSDASLSEKYQYLLYQAEESKFTYNVINNRQSEATSNIEKTGEYLTVFFLKVILRLSINAHINQFSFNKTADNNFPEKILKSIELEKLLDEMETDKINGVLELRLKYLALTCITDINNDEAYNSYRQLLYSNLSAIGKEESQRSLHFLESIIAQKINAGRREFYKDLFETYKFEIDKKLVSPNPNNITVMKYRNIYLTAMRVGEYGWVEKFIYDFEPKINDEDRHDIFELAMAQLNFEKKQYENTLKHLNKVKTDQIFFKVDVRILNLMSLYELGHYENAVSLIDSFRKLLAGSNSLTEQYRQKNMNFINSVNALIRLKSDYDNSAAEALMEKINAYELIGYKNWLKEKLLQLNKA
jgi:hypothetical protein